MRIRKAVVLIGAGVMLSLVACAAQTSSSGGSAKNSKLTAKEALSEVQPTIATWEKLLMASMMEFGRVVDASQTGFRVPDNSNYWTYDVETAGTITATLKVELNDLDEGATVGSKYYDEEGHDCFERTASPKLAALIPKFMESPCF